MPVSFIPTRRVGEAALRQWAINHVDQFVMFMQNTNELEIVYNNTDGCIHYLEPFTWYQRVYHTPTGLPSEGVVPDRNLTELSAIAFFSDRGPWLCECVNCQETGTGAVFFGELTGNEVIPLKDMIVIVSDGAIVIPRPAEAA